MPSAIKVTKRDPGASPRYFHVPFTVSGPVETATYHCEPDAVRQGDNPAPRGAYSRPSRDLEEGGEPFIFGSHPATGPKSAPPPPARKAPRTFEHVPHAGLLNELAAVLPRHEGTVITCGAEDVISCQRGFEQELSSHPTPPGLSWGGDMAREPSGHWLRHAWEVAASWQVPASIAADVIARRFPFLARELVESTGATVYASGGFVAPNAKGEGVKAARLAAAAQREQARLATAAARNEAEEPEEFEARDLGVIAIGVHRTMTARDMFNGWVTRKETNLTDASGEWDVVCFDAEMFALVGWPATDQLEGSAGLKLLGSDYVLRGRRKDMRSHGPLPAHIFDAVKRMRRVDRRGMRPDELRDASTEEGRARLALFAELLRSRVRHIEQTPETVDRLDHEWTSFLADAAVRGYGIEPTAVYDALPESIPAGRLAGFQGALQRAVAGHADTLVSPLQLVPASGTDLAAVAEDPWKACMSRFLDDRIEVSWVDARGALTRAGLEPRAWNNQSGLRLSNILTDLGFERRFVAGPDGKPSRMYVRCA